MRERHTTRTAASSAHRSRLDQADRCQSASVLLAIGGNSLIRANQVGTVPEQLVSARETARAIVDVLRQGVRLVLTHGNGPQVGAALLRSERSAKLVYPHPLEVCGATTQGEIGYILVQALSAELHATRVACQVAVVLTRVVVRPDDPAFTRPSKPIGPFYTAVEAEDRQRRLGWHVVEDAGRGYRRVVPSPEPIEVVEEPIIRTLLSQGVLVVALGGGGIPVIRDNGAFAGVEAVIDKDRASALLAAQLGVERLVISTDADHVYVNFRKPQQRALGLISGPELQRYRAAGHFAPGSMGPKIDAALGFLARGGRDVIITSPRCLVQAVAGTAGTRIVRA